ncbi:amidase [Halobium salinum]|uniref:Amidase n=1 Tax=Halobium salinum TaxID=1364940 RepID=A0ABD5PI29_9EURY|nr:amidase [Halobium salinum]
MSSVDDSSRDDDRETVRAQADRLGLSVGDDLLGELATVVRQAAEGDANPSEKGDGAVDVPEAPGEWMCHAGHRAEDSENALLAVYDESRTRTDVGPLAGVTVAVKDNIAVRGLEMTCGSAAYSVVPSFDATVVSRLLDAGATIVGKANMEPLAMGPTGEFSDFGHVTNPLDSERVAGGSSSGSGAAVAAGTVDLALGSDTGGSVRIPAACCGVVGVKPTHRLVPRYGFVDFAPSLDTVGPLARDVSTAATALEAIAGPDHRDPTSVDCTASSGTPLDGVTEELADPDDAAGLTVAVPESPLGRADDRVAAAVEGAVDRLGDLGVATDRVTLDFDGLDDAYLNVGAAEFSWLLAGSGVVRGQGSGYNEELLAAFRSARQNGLGDHVARRVLPAAVLDAETDGEAYAAGRRRAVAFAESLAAVFESADALVLPTLGVLPPRVGETTTREDLLPLVANTAPCNLVGVPAVTVPVATVDGLPVSAQAVAPRFADATALRVAGALERVAE